MHKSLKLQAPPGLSISPLRLFKSLPEGLTITPINRKGLTCKGSENASGSTCSGSDLSVGVTFDVKPEQCSDAETEMHDFLDTLGVH